MKPKSSPSSKAPVRPAAASAQAALAAAAWRDADAALAEAVLAQWRLRPALQAVLRRAAKAKVPALDAACEAADAEALALTQAVLRAAKLRGLTLVGETGVTVGFDAARHVLVRGDAAKGRPVKTLTPLVMLGRQVLVKAEVRLARAGTKADPPPARKKAPS